MGERVRRFVSRLTLWRERLLNPPVGAYPAPRPDELIICAICLLSGLPTLLGQPPSSVDALLWPPFLYVWAAALVVLPAVIIWTSLARWRGLEGEKLITAGIAFRAASRGLACAAAVYAVSVLVTGGWIAVVAGVFTVAFSLGRLWRAYEMSRWLASHLVSPS